MILIFCKGYNDIDQIVPVVHSLICSGRQDIELVLMRPGYDDKHDFRLQYLTSISKITISHYMREPSAGRLKPAIMSYLMRGIGQISITRFLLLAMRIGGRQFRNWGEEIISLFFYHLRASWYGEDYARMFFDRRNVSLIISDDRAYPEDFYKIAFQAEIPIVGISHGFNSSTSLDMSEIKQIAPKRKYKQLWKSDNFPDDFTQTALLTQTETMKKRRTNQGFQTERVHVLGNTRFCPEWRSVYSTIVPPPIIRDANPGTNKLRIVFMDHSSNYRMHADEIVSGVNAILDLNFVDFVLKPSTASQHSNKKHSHATEGLSDICRIVPNEHSHNLIAWADVVIVTHSSIFLEVLLQDKVFIYPAHFTGLTGVFEQYGSCWKVNSTNELTNALETVYKEPGYRPYSQDQVNNLLEEVVFGHTPNRDVLKEHRDLILSLESEHYRIG